MSWDTCRDTSAPPTIRSWTALGHLGHFFRELVRITRDKNIPSSSRYGEEGREEVSQVSWVVEGMDLPNESPGHFSAGSVLAGGGR